MSKKKEEWKIIRKSFRRNSTCVVPGYGGGRYTYAQAQVDVVETREFKRTSHSRTRTILTAPLYLFNHPELVLAFKVAEAAIHDIEHKIMEIESKSKKKNEDYQI